jgi:predicted RNase H-like HicB family nuclease
MRKDNGRTATTYTVLIEKGENGTYGASAPDLPGCFAVADSFAEVLRLMGEAMPAHIEVMQEYGDKVPEPRIPASVSVAVSEHMAKMGSKGGKVTASRMTSVQKRARAVKAAKARHNKAAATLVVKKRPGARAQRVRAASAATT